MTLASGHFTVDMYAGLLPALYPMLTDRFALDLTTVGLVALANSAASALSQPIFRWIAHLHGTRIVILSSLLLSIPVVWGPAEFLGRAGFFFAGAIGFLAASTSPSRRPGFSLRSSEWRRSSRRARPLQWRPLWPRPEGYRLPGVAIGTGNRV